MAEEEKQEELCHCGLRLHYKDPVMRFFVERLILLHGPMVRVTVEDRTWLVPRHYIALHGLKAQEIENKGFEEVFD